MRTKEKHKAAFFAWRKIRWKSWTDFVCSGTTHFTAISQKGINFISMIMNTNLSFCFHIQRNHVINIGNVPVNHKGYDYTCSFEHPIRLSQFYLFSPLSQPHEPFAFQAITEMENPFRLFTCSTAWLLLWISNSIWIDFNILFKHNIHTVLRTYSFIYEYSSIVPLWTIAEFQ